MQERGIVVMLRNCLFDVHVLMSPILVLGCTYTYLMCSHSLMTSFISTVSRSVADLNTFHTQCLNMLVIPSILHKGIMHCPEVYLLLIHSRLTKGTETYKNG